MIDDKKVKLSLNKPYIFKHFLSSQYVNKYIFKN